MMFTLPAAPPPFVGARATADAAEVAELDRRFQLAVKTNDAKRIDAILHPSFALILGDGTVVTRAEILKEARQRIFEYEIQDEDPGTQMVRVWGSTAVVTARLRIKGRGKDGQPFARLLWFSDTYVRTPKGWRYAFGQASRSLPFRDC
jgi:ketosteroid isomerase-like protein